MKTIETTARVDPQGKLVIELASDLPPGDHSAVIVIADSLPVASAVAPSEEATSESTNVRANNSGEKPRTAWTSLRDNAGTVAMPEDWSKEHDHYLYGTPKRET